MREAPAKGRSDGRALFAWGKALAVASLVASSSCATAPTTISISGTGENPSGMAAHAGAAILILAMAGPVNVAGQYELRQVDMASNAFISAPIAVTYAG